MDSPVAQATQATETMKQWQVFRKHSPKAKMVCIDIQPYGNTQAPERADILNIGGFGDAVFNVVASFLSDDANRFVSEVEAVEV